MNVRPIKIAEALNISPATVTKYMNRLRDDAFLLQNKEAQQRIAENIARWNNMIGEAYKILTTTSREDRKLHAIKIIADITKKIADYEVLVGKVRKAPDEHHLRGRIGVHSVDIDSIRDEVSQEDLDKTILAIAEALKKREKLARVKVIPLLPKKNGAVEKSRGGDLLTR
jgi:predicted transcriptional regulator